MALVRLADFSSKWVTSGLPTIHPESPKMAGTVSMEKPKCENYLHTGVLAMKHAHALSPGTLGREVADFVVDNCLTSREKEEDDDR
jgi:hypothetical protein